MTPSDAIDALQDDPEEFLKKHLLVIAGSTQPSGTRDYWIGYKDGPTMPGNPEKFRIQSSTLGQTGVEHKFSAHSVKMLASRDVIKSAADLAQIPGHVLSGSLPPLMVTGQLTACTFAVGKAPAGLICTHLQPGANIIPGPAMGLPASPAARPLSGPELNTAVLNAGKFAGGGKVDVAFGPKFYPGQNVTIVGVNKGGVWSIWAQHTNGMTPSGAVQVY